MGNHGMEAGQAGEALVAEGEAVAEGAESLTEEGEAPDGGIKGETNPGHGAGNEALNRFKSGGANQQVCGVAGERGLRCTRREGVLGR